MLARGTDALLNLLGDPGIVHPFRIAIIAIFSVAGLALVILGLGLTAEERRWIASRRLARRSAAAAVDEDLDDVPVPASRPARAPVAERPSRATVIAEPARTRERSQRPLRERQPSLALGDSYTLPSVDLLNAPPPPANVAIDKAGLERNARLLESVLDDFSVKGEIVRGPARSGGHHVRAGARLRDQGEPRHPAGRRHRPQHVRALRPRRHHSGPRGDRHRAAQCEARDGELRNWSQPAFEDQVASLPIILGKNIAGDPVVADLAPMPTCSSPAPPARASRSGSTA